MPANNVKKKKQAKHTLSWFIDRIGRTVYRIDTGVYGVKIKSKVHAEYLEMVEHDLDLYYQDEPFRN